MSEFDPDPNDQPAPPGGEADGPDAAPEPVDGSGSPDPRLRGCLLAFAGMLVLTLTPAVGAWIPISDTVSVGALGLAVLLLVGGAVVGLLAGRE